MNGGCRTCPPILPRRWAGAGFGTLTMRQRAIRLPQLHWASPSAALDKKLCKHTHGRRGVNGILSFHPDRMIDPKCLGIIGVLS